MQDKSKDIRTFRNSGFAFGVLKDRPDLVKYIPLALTGGMFAYWIWLLSKPGRWPEKIGTGIALTGAVSNTAERLKNGEVIDDISIKYAKDRTFFFNKADMAIWIGSLITLLGHSGPADSCK